MFVSNSMTRKVITVEPNDGIFKAQELMAENKIRHLPVFSSGNRLVGVVEDEFTASDAAVDMVGGSGNE